MIGKILFSFVYGLDLAMDQVFICEHSFICFGVVLDMFKVTTHSTGLTFVLIGIIFKGIKTIL